MEQKIVCHNVKVLDARRYDMENGFITATGTSSVANVDHPFNVAERALEAKNKKEVYPFPNRKGLYYPAE